jgi:chemotaxis response regulator CheB
MAQNALSPVPPGEENDLTIVAIGASAGGIEALSDLISHLPADTGMAFVLVQHLDPKHHSILTELLARKTSMKVSEVSDGLLVKPNAVYVIPPNAMMSISSRIDLSRSARWRHESGLDRSPYGYGNNEFGFPARAGSCARGGRFDGDGVRRQ